MLFVVFCCCFMETKLASNISCWALFTAPYSHRPRFCVGECNFCLLFLFLSFNVSSQRCSRRFSLWTDWVTPIRPCSGKCDFVQWLIPVWIFYWPPCALNDIRDEYLSLPFHEWLDKALSRARTLFIYTFSELVFTLEWITHMHSRTNADSDSDNGHHSSWSQNYNEILFYCMPYVDTASTLPASITLIQIDVIPNMRFLLTFSILFAGIVQRTKHSVMIPASTSWFSFSSSSFNCWWWFGKQLEFVDLDIADSSRLWHNSMAP